MKNISRRNFLAGSAATFAGGAASLGFLNQSKAWAADTTGYKALVCVFLFGGLDHADTVFPFAQSEYDQLAALRTGLFSSYANSGDATRSRNRNNLLPIAPTNASDFGTREFALAPQMSEMQNLFQTGEMAIIGNVGPLIEPTNRQSLQDGTSQLPPRLFSHNDQQSTWMALDTEGAQTGWGGQFADAVLASDVTANSTFTSIATSGTPVFLAGNTSNAFAAVTGGNTRELNIVDANSILGGNSRFDAQRAALGQYFEAMEFNNPSTMQRDFGRMSSDGIESVRVFNAALGDILPITTAFPDTGLGRQMQSVAQIIEARNAFSVSRQIFFVGIGGFDTHSNQANALPNLQSEISTALASFRNAMIERGVWNDVTVFTASDFGRTMIDNGDGTDHGWGSHHFVLGGSVVGGQIYGDLPSPDIQSSFYTPSRGRLIPTTSVEQYAATLGSWFGLSDSEIATALPNLSTFNQANLGFI